MLLTILAYGMIVFFMYVIMTKKMTLLTSHIMIPSVLKTWQEC